MPQLRIRDIKEEIEEIKSELGTLTANTFTMGSQLDQKCVDNDLKHEQTNRKLAEGLGKVKAVVYVLTVVQIGLVAHLLFSVLSR